MHDAIALLKADHKNVKALFTEASELGDGAYASRSKLFRAIDHELTIHTQIEETIFYPAFKERTKSHSDERDGILQAYEEHAAAKGLIAKLQATDPKDETYKAKLHVLSEMINHHIEAEETEIFKEAQRLFTADELVELGERLAAAKTSIAFNKV